jgi:hypothetical protein
LGWALEWGPYESLLWDSADPKALPEPLLRRPVLPDWCRPYWDAFWRAAHGRGMVLGYGIGAQLPLALTELAQAITEAGVRGVDARAMWLNILQAMDAAYMAHANRRDGNAG